jgi:hypothetical protein
MEAQKLNELNASNLKLELWKTLNDLREAKIQPGHGDAIASQAREILRTVRTQLMVTNQAKRPVPADCLHFAEK